MMMAIVVIAAVVVVVSVLFLCVRSRSGIAKAKTRDTTHKKVHVYDEVVEMHYQTLAKDLKDDHPYSTKTKETPAHKLIRENKPASGKWDRYIDPGYLENVSRLKSATKSVYKSFEESGYVENRIPSNQTTSLRPYISEEPACRSQKSPHIAYSSKTSTQNSGRECVNSRDSGYISTVP